MQEILERDDIQGLVLRAYRMPQGRLPVLPVHRAATARSWLEVTGRPAHDRRGVGREAGLVRQPRADHVGLAALGLPARKPRELSRRLPRGHGGPRRLPPGDSGEDLPAHWEASRRSRRGACTRCCSSRRTGRRVLDDRVAAFVPIAAAHGLEPVGRATGRRARRRRRSDREHFGFRDGISQPTLRGSGLEDAQHADRLAVAPGEFVLGYPDESATDRRSARGARPQRHLRRVPQAAPARRGVPRLGGRQADGDLLAAKLMGRWPSGAPVALARHCRRPGAGRGSGGA